VIGLFSKNLLARKYERSLPRFTTMTVDAFGALLALVQAANMSASWVESTFGLQGQLSTLS
jgi:hypothetical protein